MDVASRAAPLAGLDFAGEAEAGAFPDAGGQVNEHARRASPARRPAHLSYGCRFGIGQRVEHAERMLGLRITRINGAWFASWKALALQCAANNKTRTNYFAGPPDCTTLDRALNTIWTLHSLTAPVRSVC